MSNDEVVTKREKPEDLKGILYFSYQDKDKVEQLIKELKEELNILRKSPTNTNNVLKRHIVRHECHHLSGEKIFEVSFKIGKETKLVTSFAATEEQVKGEIEYELISNGITTPPVYKKVKCLGVQPIEWCIDWTERMLKDVTEKFEVEKKRVKTLRKM